MLLSDAEVRKYIVEGFLGSDAAPTGYICKVVEDETEVFGNQVSREIRAHALKHTRQVIVCTRKSLVMAGTYNDNATFVNIGDVGSLE